MSVISQLQNLAGFIQVRPTTNNVQGLPQFSAVDDGTRADLLQARGRLLRIQRAIETLADAANIRTRFNFERPSAQSNQALALDLTHTAATLASDFEINNSSMSFSPFGPEWGGASTAAITIGGEYNGAHGTGQLTFEVRRAGTKGVNDLRIRVEDPQGNRIKNINIRASHDPDRQYSLNNGLFLTLGPGLLIDRDATTIDVFDNVGSTADPSKPLGGIRNDNPNLEFGSPAIVDGSFQINGQNIAVNTTDSLNDIVSRINLSGAGVTAVFNPTTEKIEFLQDTLGSVSTIDIQGDTSNFIESTKLDTAVVVDGIDPQTEQSIRDVPALSQIRNGEIVINGESIRISRRNDSLNAVFDKINQSAAGATATFNSTTQRVTIESNDPEQELTLDSNGTRFFSTISLLDGSVEPTVASRGVSRGRAYRVADALEVLSTEISALMQDKNFSAGAANAGLFRSPVAGALSSESSGFGFKIDTTNEALLRGDFASLNRRAFTRNLQVRGDEVKVFLAGPDGQGGLIGQLFSATEKALANVSYGLGQTGTYVDTYA